MRLFSKLFSRTADPEKERLKALLRRISEDSERPQGAHKAASAGAEIRRRFFFFKEEVEANLARPAIWFASDKGVLMVHPKLREELRKQPDAEVLEAALSNCFVTPEARRELNGAWPWFVAEYRGKENSEFVLREKSGLLAKYVVSNLGASEIGAAFSDEVAKSDKQDRIVRVEEIAVWYRVLDELAFRFLRERRGMFMDFLEDDLALNLALAGSPPDLIGETMVARSREYAQYREWLPAENAPSRGTLLWEAAKHIGEPMGLDKEKLFVP
jgi:hypothetical protein